MKHDTQWQEALNEGENKFLFSTDRKASVVELCANDSGAIVEVRVGNRLHISYTDDMARSLDHNNFRFPLGVITVEPGQNVGVRVLDMPQGSGFRLTFETMGEDYPDPEPPPTNGESSEESLDAIEQDLEDDPEYPPDSDLPASES